MSCAPRGRWACRPSRFGVLGEEDPSLWSIWDHPSDLAAPERLKQDSPWRRRRYRWDGDILRITGQPHPGSRTIDMDAYNWTVTDEHMLTFPRPTRSSTTAISREKSR